MTRTPAHPIDPMFTERWSPRAMSGEVVSKEDLCSLFEAARWSPSCGNLQPWNFIYAQANTPAFEIFWSALFDGNKPWCRRAGALVVVASTQKGPNDQPYHFGSFDTGAAWMSLALQARKMGLVSHGMLGFNVPKIQQDLAVPAHYKVECMIALGHPGRLEDLPEGYHSRETPNERKPIEEFIFEGTFAPKAP